jgi:hypothetical protein
MSGIALAAAGAGIILLAAIVTALRLYSNVQVFKERGFAASPHYARIYKIVLVISLTIGALSLLIYMLAR